MEIIRLQISSMIGTRTRRRGLVAEGLVSGSNEGGKTILNPKGNATRAQVATILMRFCGKH